MITVKLSNPHNYQVNVQIRVADIDGITTVVLQPKSVTNISAVSIVTRLSELKASGINVLSYENK